jgi:hypothetical protein
VRSSNVVVAMLLAAVAGAVIYEAIANNTAGTTRTTTEVVTVGGGGNKGQKHRHGGRGLHRKGGKQGKPVTGVHRLVNKTFHCRGPVTPGAEVFVTVNNGQHVDGVHLDRGCTGGPLIVHVHTNGADGVKVHTGVHDLTVKGSVTCSGKHGTVHQDGIQAMGGKNVTFLGFKVDCPSGNNGGIWINAGRNRHSTPTNIICSHCDLFERNAAVHVGPYSIHSGAVDSRLHRGTGGSSPANCTRVDPRAVSPVVSGNTCS